MKITASFSQHIFAIHVRHCNNKAALHENTMKISSRGLLTRKNICAGSCQSLANFDPIGLGNKP